MELVGTLDRIDPQAVPTVTTAIITTTEVEQILLVDVHIANTTTGGLTFQWYIVPTSGSAAQLTNSLGYDVPVSANDYQRIPQAQILLKPNERLMIKASGSGLVFTATVVRTRLQSVVHL